jgi:hypothetical protein
MAIAHELVPEGCEQEREMSGVGAEQRPGDPVRGIGHREARRAEHGLEDRLIDRRRVHADELEHPQRYGQRQRHHPWPQAVLVLPRHHAVPEHEAVGLFEVLHDLVGMEHGVVGEPDGDARRKREHQHLPHAQAWPRRPESHLPPMRSALFSLSVQ